MTTAADADDQGGSAGRLMTERPKTMPAAAQAAQDEALDIDRGRGLGLDPGRKIDRERDADDADRQVDEERSIPSGNRW